MEAQVFESVGSPASLQFSRPSTPAKSPGRSPAKDGQPNFHARLAVSSRLVKPSQNPEFLSIIRNDKLSVSEKELAARVAAAAERIKGWITELESWHWTASFDVPVADSVEPASDLDLNKASNGTVEYVGSLQSAEVQKREDRLDEIHAELSVLDVEDLKERILNLHSRPAPKSPSSASSPNPPTFMDEHSLFVTQTLVQCLPYLSDLTERLRTWNIRIAVLREVPIFLQQLQSLQIQMLEASHIVAERSPFPRGDEALRSAINATDSTRASLQDSIAACGQRLDVMLDRLEGQSDVLPHHWIDQFESVEANFTDWIVAIERRVFGLRMALYKQCSNANASTAVAAVNGEAVEKEKEATVDEERGIPIQKVLVEEGEPHEDDEQRRSSNSSSSSLGESDHSIYIASSVPVSPVRAVRLDSPCPTLPSSPMSAKGSDIQNEDSQADTEPKTPLVESNKSNFNGLLKLRTTATTPTDEDLNIYDCQDDSPSDRSAHQGSNMSKPPLNSLMVKKRDTGRQFPIDNSVKPHNLTIIDPDSLMPSIETSKNLATSPLHSAISPVLPLDEQISNILEAMPTPIRLKSGPSPNAPDVRKQRFRSMTPNSLRRNPLINSLYPALTLAPADEPSSRRTSAANDPEVKLYHLSQPGKDIPIKLFIRRVGENGERVMVRVGGGWADLAEYLRIYADHHGHRTASEGRVELHGLASPTSPAGATTPPVSSDSRRASVMGTTITPHSDGVTPPPPLASDLTSPKEDTPQSDRSTGSRRSSAWDEVGLAGPFTRRSEISGEKKEWVDGIVEQAKKSIGQNFDVGHLGKSGSTRRVFLKGKTPDRD